MLTAASDGSETRQTAGCGPTAPGALASANDPSGPRREPRPRRDPQRRLPFPTPLDDSRPHDDPNGEAVAAMPAQYGLRDAVTT